ncbi:MAG TPA: restriction endonuclease [Lysobacter sp.]
MGYGLKRVSERRSDALTQVGWQQLESLLADYYRRQGYDVEHCGTGTGGSRFDGGVDLRLRRDGDYVLVQAKHWNARQVPHNAVHELLGITVNEGATGAILVTSGEFTRAAIEAATRQGHVQLVDGEDLRTMLGEWTRAEVHLSRRPAFDPDARWKRGAMDLSRHVGERLLSAAEDGLRQGAYARRGRNAATVALTTILFKFAMTIVLAILVVVAFLYVVNGLTSRMSQRLSPAASTAPSAITPSPSDERAPPAGTRQAPMQIEPETVRAPTAAELREQKRRADEAIRIIEASTPEM